MRQENESSVEEILESIKKVIARDNRAIAAATRERRAAEGVDSLQEDMDNLDKVLAESEEAGHFEGDSDLDQEDLHSAEAGDECEELGHEEVELGDSSEIDAPKARKKPARKSKKTLAKASKSTKSKGDKAPNVHIDNPKNADALDQASDNSENNDSSPGIDEILELGPSDFAEEHLIARSIKDAEGLISKAASDSMRENIEALAMIAEPGASPQIVRSGETSLEEMVREMLRPMLAQWLDANLPTMVETMVRAEITRIAGKRG